MGLKNSKSSFEGLRFLRVEVLENLREILLSHSSEQLSTHFLRRENHLPNFSNQATENRVFKTFIQTPQRAGGSPFHKQGATKQGRRSVGFSSWASCARVLHAQGWSNMHRALRDTGGIPEPADYGPEKPRKQLQEGRTTLR